MKTVFIDTSFIIALHNLSDPYHGKAKDLLTILENTQRPQLTTTAVLLELGDGFARKSRWDLIASFFADAFVDPMLEIQPVDVPLVARAKDFRNSRPDKDWGLTDCVSFVVMAERGLEEALTADRHFQQAGFRALLLQP
jgi:predicted nucleic acid-binding protein